MRLKEPDIVWRAVADEVVVLDTRSSQYSSLNESGAVLWARLSDGATVADLVAELCQHYEVDEGTAARDVEVFLEALRAADMLDES
jgi:hypothetical protein